MAKAHLLIILDGWGYREDPEHNAILTANTPTWDYLWQHYPHTLINGSGTAVGLPDGQMGNSEVGHLNIGAGRIVYQDYSRINASIETGKFFSNPVLTKTLEETQAKNAAIHILGLLSPGGVHSHIDQIKALIKMAVEKKCNKVYLHAFLDGRDTPPNSALNAINHLQLSLANCSGDVRFASLCGRYYAMDRDKRWDRIELVYRLLTESQAEFHAPSAELGLAQAYARNESDEFVKPTIISKPAPIQNGDSVIFMNFRADRSRQLSYALTEKNFSEFSRPKIITFNHFVTLTQYASDLNAEVAFPPLSMNNVLGEHLSKLKKQQLRIAETEKFAHVTYFFNGGREQPYTGEDRILIPSPNVTTYDLQPEMSAFELTEKLTQAIASKQYDFIACNFANPDMVGHTGNFPATVKAIEAIDQCLKKILECLIAHDSEMLITADHGNAECMYNNSIQQAHTAHTSAPVPLLYIGRPADFINDTGALSDLAPTILTTMNITVPKEMTGKCLLKFK